MGRKPCLDQFFPISFHLLAAIRDAPGTELRQVKCEGFASQQVNGNGVRRKGIDYDGVAVGFLIAKRQTAIAENDLGVRGAVRQKPEAIWISSDLDDHRVDFIEDQTFAVPGEASD